MPLKVPVKEREQPKAGNYQGVCYMVRDVGSHKYEYKGEEKISHRVIILYEIDALMEKGDYAGKRFVVSERLPFTFGFAKSPKKTKLRERIEGWYGRELSEAEVNDFDIESLMGKNCMINLIVNDKGYIEITSVSPVPQKMEIITPENAEAPKWVENEWQESEEYRALQAMQAAKGKGEGANAEEVFDEANK